MFINLMDESLAQEYYQKAQKCKEKQKWSECILNTAIAQNIGVSDSDKKTEEVEHLIRSLWNHGQKTIILFLLDQEPLLDDTKGWISYYTGYIYSCLSKYEYKSLRLEAVKHYEKAIQKGNREALIKMGIFYMNGDTIKQDYQKALELWSKALELGSKWAYPKIGFLYLYGHGVKKDWFRAFELFMKCPDHYLSRYSISVVDNDGEVEKGFERIDELEKKIELLNSKLLEIDSNCDFEEVENDYKKPTNTEELLNVISQKIDRLEEVIKGTKLRILELEYMPGGVGMEKAKVDFNYRQETT